MISYVTIGTNDLEVNAKFYDAVLGVLGASPFARNGKVHCVDGEVGWTRG